MTKEKDLQAKRNQFALLKQHGIIQKNLGARCVNCGSEENVEYHHIVPLVNGGSNALSNIVPLCKECHRKAHDQAYKIHGKPAGRHRAKKPDNFDTVARHYMNGEATWQEACELTGIGRNTFFRMLARYGYRSMEKKQAQHLRGKAKERHFRRLKKKLQEV